MRIASDTAFPGSCYAGDVQVLRALKAGARGYLLKNSLHKRPAGNDPGGAWGEEVTLR
jgi:hypothetical protein